MPERDRDQSVDQMLRRVMSDDMPPLEGACLDGETIAAWTDGSLRGAQAAVVERHVADCARCRALMASFLRTTPALPAAEPLWRRWHLNWAVPLATAATAAAIWVALPENRTSPAVPAQETAAITRDESRTALPAAPAAEPAPKQAADAPPATARALQPQEEKARAADSAENEVRLRADAAATRQTADVEPGRPSAAAPAAAGAASPAPAAPPAPLASVAERSEADSKKEVAANSAVAPLAAARQAFAPVPIVEIVAPGGMNRWRIVTGNRVERSANAGGDWTAATVTPAGALAAGAAPSATVCWLVGARGGVYLTTDGARFTRLPFPEQVDLVSITATDDQTAIVSSSDGRSWRTTDRGRSWVGR